MSDRPTGTGRGGKEALHCSFCRKNQHEVLKLIAGPKVYICNECVSLCNEIIRDELKSETDEKQGGLPLPESIHAALEEHVVGRSRPRRCCRWRSTTTTSAPSPGSTATTTWSWRRATSC